MKNNIKLSLYSLLLIFFSSSVFAQENNIYELNATNELSKENSTSNKSFKNQNNSNRENFYDLAFKLHPTTYITNNVAKKNSGNGNYISKLIFNDTKSFNLLKEANSDLSYFIAS
jgi:hypothetical protein